MSVSAVISLTYDGTQWCHLGTVIPQLEAAGFLGTFYADPVMLMENLPEWQAAQVRGHEIGNGCLIGSALPDGSLPAWTPAMILDDIEEADFLLEELFPDQPDHSFGMPWGEARCAADTDYLPTVAHAFNVIRTGERGVNQPGEFDLKALRSLPMEDLTGSQLIEVCRLAIHQGGWSIFAFDGVGMGDRAVDAADHAELIEFLAASRDVVQVLPVITMAERLLDAPKPTIRLV